MPRAEKPALLNWLYRREFDRPVMIREVLAEGAQAVLRKSNQEAEGYSEANANSFWNYVLTHQESEERRGLIRSFKILDDTAKTLTWYGVGDPSSVRVGTGRMRIRLRHRP